jgi:hypothetical protein
MRSIRGLTLERQRVAWADSTARCQMLPPKVFVFAAPLKDEGKFCVTFARATMRDFFSSGLTPPFDCDTATVTFIESEGETMR